MNVSNTRIVEFVIEHCCLIRGSLIVDVSVQGVTIQGGPMIRTMDVAAMSAAYAKRRRKKKRRKQILQARFATVS